MTDSTSLIWTDEQAQDCLEWLEQSNRDIPEWACPCCGAKGTRLHWAADHFLLHWRRGDRPTGREPAKQEPTSIEGKTRFDLIELD